VVPVLLPQSDLSFGLRCGQGTRCLPNSARSLVHHEIPSTCILPPSLPSLSPVSAHLEATYLARALPYILHIFEQLSPCILLGLGITWAFSHPHLFVSRPGVLSGFQRRHIQSYACASPAATFDPSTRSSHILSASNTSAWMCTPMQPAILMVHKLTAVATSKARLLRQVCPVP
jgi:hypothetical protein